MIGADFTLNIMRILALAMTIIVIATFTDKRSASGQKRSEPCALKIIHARCSKKSY